MHPELEKLFQTYDRNDYHPIVQDSIAADARYLDELLRDRDIEDKKLISNAVPDLRNYYIAQNILTGQNIEDDQRGIDSGISQLKSHMMSLKGLTTNIRFGSPIVDVDSKIDHIKDVMNFHCGHGNWEVFGIENRDENTLNSFYIYHFLIRDPTKEVQCKIALNLY